ncbi:MAG TPA: cytochrome P450 [Pseudonocardia sp.]|nr:cytochrome P450 [Pseudonocardia sp.]
MSDADRGTTTITATRNPERLEDVDLADLSLFAQGPPRDIFKWLRDEDPVHWTEPPATWADCEEDGAGYWSLTRAREIAQAASDLKTFSVEKAWYLNYETDAPVPLESMQGMLTGMQPPQHTKFRGLLTKAFVPNTVNRLEAQIRRRLTIILDRVIESGQCDLVNDIAVPLPTQVIADLFGFPEESAPLVHEWSMAFAATQDPDALRGGGIEQGMRALEEIIEYGKAIANERRKDPKDDLLSRLVVAEVDGRPINEEELGSFIFQILVAGNETSRNSIGVGFKTLMDHPGQWAALQGDSTLSVTGAEEILRWLAPVMYMRRTATADVTLGDKQVRAGDKVIQWFVASNFDPEINDNPEKFDITRKSVRHQTFGGGGRRFCLGAGLARLELRIALEEVSRRMPDIAPSGRQKWLRSNFFGGLLELPVTFSPAQQSGVV